MSDFLAMGGYAAYIWPAYAVTVAMLAGTLIATLADLRRREATLKALEAARPPRPRAAAAAKPADATPPESRAAP